MPALIRARDTSCSRMATTHQNVCAVEPGGAMAVANIENFNLHGNHLIQMNLL
jgi:hypothetical protein